MDLGLDGRACIVTGASRGIGFAVVEQLLGEGARVLLVARDGEALDAAVARLGAASVDRVATLAADVTDPDAPSVIADACHDRFGAIDVLVNNAGTSAVRPLDELTDREFYEQFEINVMGPLRLMREVAPRMAAANGGRIVNVCSSSGVRTSLTNAAYAAAKAAQINLSGAFAEAWREHGVAVNAVAPGAAATELWTAAGGLADQLARRRGVTSDEVIAGQAAKTPLGRLSEPQEVAAVIVLLCSTRTRLAAGATWPVGFSLA